MHWMNASVALVVAGCAYGRPSTTARPRLAGRCVVVHYPNQGADTVLLTDSASDVSGWLLARERPQPPNPPPNSLSWFKWRWRSAGDSLYLILDDAFATHTFRTVRQGSSFNGVMDVHNGAMAVPSNPPPPPAMSINRVACPVASTVAT